MSLDKAGIDELKNEFDKFVMDRCVTNEQGEDEIDAQEAEDEDIPNFVEELLKKLLSPSFSGVNLTRIDIKRIGTEMDYSLPIKERNKMFKAMMRHMVSKPELEQVFNVINKHIDGRLLIYKELGDTFPASKYIFDNYETKIEQTKKMLERIVRDFEEFDPNAESVIM